MTEVVDRVAKAIEALCDGRDGKAIPPWRIVARAAIEAMRKPTPKMCKAACKSMSPGKRPTERRVSNSAKHGIRYRAMIDEALMETTK